MRASMDGPVRTSSCACRQRPGTGVRYSGMSQRKPIIYLAVILPVFLGGALGIVYVLMRAFAHVRDVPLNAIPDLNGLLMALPAALLWIPVSLLVSNLILLVVPPLRRRAASYAASTGSVSFGVSQLAVLRATLWFGLLCVPLITLGFVL